MIWKEYLKTATDELIGYLKKDIQYSNIPEIEIRQIAGREIELFIERVKCWNSVKIIIEANSDISESDQNKINKFLDKRKNGTPLAQILGESVFMGLSFKVDKNTLIPRPETEELVEHVSNRLKNESIVILIDIGTGSGCVLTAILKNISEQIKIYKVFAIDKSKKALDIARMNLEANLKDIFNIKYLNSSLLDSVHINKNNQKDKKIFIVANLPYLSEKEFNELSHEVKSFEPKSALVGGKNGHELICQLIDQAIDKFEKFEMFLEISPTIYQEIIRHLKKQDTFIGHKKLLDLSGKIRFLILTKK